VQFAERRVRRGQLRFLVAARSVVACFVEVVDVFEAYINSFFEHLKLVLSLEHFCQVEVLRGFSLRVEGHRPVD